VLKVTDLKRQFKSGDTTVNAVNGIDLTIPDGQFVSIIGQSGSGKTSLLSLLGALDKPSSGSIEVDGRDITKMNGGELNQYRAKTIGFVFQSYNLVPNLTALENVMLPMEFLGKPKRDRIERAKNLLHEVGLNDGEVLRKPGSLSGGQQQRVAIARALANHPKYILADEPTGNLDSQTGKKIFNLLHDLSLKEKTTIIVVTHDLAIAGKTNKSFRIKDGRVVNSTDRSRT
jgi:putative ABC transport system ATP-binding protein